MSLRHKDPLRERITDDTVVFDDLADLMIEMKQLCPSAAAAERNGVSMDTAVDCLVRMSMALSRFEASDEPRHATEYCAITREMTGYVDILRFRANNHRLAIAKRTLLLSEDKQRREEMASALSFCQTCSMMRQMCASLARRVAQRRREVNKEWNLGRGIRKAEMNDLMEQTMLTRKQQREIRRQQWRSRHDGLKGGHGGVGAG